VILLSIETATGKVGCALTDTAGGGAAFSVSGRRRHGETLAPMIEQVCRLGGLSLGDVEAVAVDVGPGLFTGLRVGVATAKALGLSLGVPLVAVTSLEALAYPLRHWTGPTVAVVDARRGEVFWRVFHPCPTTTSGYILDAQGEARVGSPALLGDALAETGAEILLVGDGAERYREMLEVLAQVRFAGEEHRFPDPSAVAALGLVQMARGESQSYEGVSPVYLRDADVRIGWIERPAPGVTAQIGPAQGGPAQGGPVDVGGSLGVSGE
jgi:tRNA threonylcarbamoyladenosine biosynthesis protein TsaB